MCGGIKIDKKASRHPFVTLDDNVHVAIVSVHNIPIAQYLNSWAKHERSYAKDGKQKIFTVNNIVSTSMMSPIVGTPELSNLAPMGDETTRQ